MNAIRASGLIPVNPRIVINKYTQLLMYIAEQAIIYWYPDWIHHSIYTSQVIYIMYCTMLSMDRDLEGRRWLHVEVGRQESYRRYDKKNMQKEFFLYNQSLSSSKSSISGFSCFKNINIYICIGGTKALADASTKNASFFYMLPKVGFLVHPRYYVHCTSPLVHSRLASFFS